MKKFSSEVDTWIALVLFFSVGFSLYMAIMVLLESISLVGILVVAALVLIGAALPLWLFISTKYIVNENELTVQSGPFKWKINIQEIKEVKKTRNPLSSPALSLNRLLITYENNKQIMVSPKERALFIESINQSL